MRLLRYALIAAALTSVAAISTAGAMSIKSPDGKGDKPDVKPSGPGAIGSDGTNPVPAPKKKKKSAAEKQSYNEFRNGYEKAYALIYDAQDYEAGIITLQALHRDDHPDVANLI